MGCCKSRRHRSTVVPALAEAPTLVASRKIAAIEHMYRCLTPTYTIAQWFQITGPVNAPKLVAALRSAQRQRSNLQVVLRGKVLVLEYPFPDVEIVVDTSNPEALTAASLAQRASHELKLGLGKNMSELEGKLPWRAVVLDDGWTMIIALHMLCDAQALVMLQRDMVEHLAGGGGKRRDTERLVGLHDIMKLPRSAPWRFTGIHMLLVMANCCAKRRKKPPRKFKEGSGFPKPEAFAPYEDRCMQINVAKIDDVHTLLSTSRAHGATLTSLFVAALAIALRRRMIGVGDKQFHPILTADARRHFTDVEIKKHFGSDMPLSDMFGNFSVALPPWFRICVSNEGPRSSLWDVVAQTSRGMKPLISRKAVDAGKSRELAALSLVGENGQRLDSFMNVFAERKGMQGRYQAISVGNVGVAKDLTQGEFSVSQSYLTLNQCLFGFYAYLSTVTIEDQLFLTLGTVSPVISPSGAESLLFDVVTLLEEAKRASLNSDFESVISAKMDQLGVGNSNDVTLMDPVICVV